MRDRCRVFMWATGFKNPLSENLTRWAYLRGFHESAHGEEFEVADRQPLGLEQQVTQVTVAAPDLFHLFSILPSNRGLAGVTTRQAPTRHFGVGAVPIPLLKGRTLAGAGKLADVSAPRLVDSVLDFDCVAVSSVVPARTECIHAKILCIRITGYSGWTGSLWDFGQD